MVDLTLENLEGCFKSAKKRKYLYVGVKIQVEDFEKSEIIISHAANFDRKLETYRRAYNEDLTMKNMDDKYKILGFTYANSFKGIEDDLVQV